MTSDLAKIKYLQTMSAARDEAYKTAADIGAAVLSVVGICKRSGRAGCFVRVPFGAAACGSASVTRTTLQAGAFAQLLLCRSVDEASDVLGFLVAGQPLLLLGDDLQSAECGDAIALFERGIVAPELCPLGPNRCARCNCSIPNGRTRLIGPDAYCIRCQALFEQTSVQGARNVRRQF